MNYIFWLFLSFGIALDSSADASIKAEASTTKPVPQAPEPPPPSQYAPQKIAPTATKPTTPLPAAQTASPNKAIPPQAPVSSANSVQNKAEEAQLSALVNSVQKHYDRTTSASFSFEQVYSHRLLLANTESSKGEVFFTPGNMLWRYNEPKERKKEFYIEGRKFTYHLVNDKQAFTHNCFEKDTLSASITFLWGKGKLKESFTIQPFQGPVANSALKWFTLIPKEKNASVKSISLGIDPKSGVVIESIVTDLSDGVNSFRFSNYKTNPKIPAQLFHFLPAKGVKVEPMPNVECKEKTLTPPPAPSAPKYPPAAPQNKTPPKPSK